MRIETEAAVESLWLALEWEPVRFAEVFDQIAYRLRRNPRFRDMSIAEIDLLLADERREFEHDVDEYSWRLVRAFKDAVGFDETDGVAA